MVLDVRVWHVIIEATQEDSVENCGRDRHRSVEKRNSEHCPLETCEELASMVSVLESDVPAAEPGPVDFKNHRVPYFVLHNLEISLTRLLILLKDHVTVLFHIIDKTSRLRSILAPTLDGLANCDNSRGEHKSVLKIFLVGLFSLSRLGTQVARLGNLWGMVQSQHRRVLAFDVYSEALVPVSDKNTCCEQEENLEDPVEG
jgi:hypothetical protein